MLLLILQLQISPQLPRISTILRLRKCPLKHLRITVCKIGQQMFENLLTLGQNNINMNIGEREIHYHRQPPILWEKPISRCSQVFVFTFLTAQARKQYIRVHVTGKFSILLPKENWGSSSPKGHVTSHILCSFDLSDCYLTC